MSAGVSSCECRSVNTRVWEWYECDSLFLIMTIICCRKSPLFLVRLSYFLFLCIHFQLSDTELLTGKKSVRPLQRSKIADFHNFRSHDSTNIIHHNPPKQVPYITKYQLSYDQHTRFFLYLPSAENPNFFHIIYLGNFYQFLPINQTLSNYPIISTISNPSKRLIASQSTQNERHFNSSLYHPP